MRDFVRSFIEAYSYINHDDVASGGFGKTPRELVNGLKGGFLFQDNGQSKSPG